jgi:hypothetical protein
MEMSDKLYSPDALFTEKTVIYWIGGSLGPRSDLDAVENIITPLPCPKPNSDSCVVQL